MALSRLSLHKHICRLKDPRLNRRKRHLLGDILTIAICAVIAGSNTWPDIETFGHKRLDWLRRFLELPNGIPSHDTFERVFDRLQPSGEDASRVQKRHDAENFALLRRLALALLKRHPDKGSMRTKRYRTTLDVAFLEEVLKQEF